jgi:hypothetical protein
MDLLVNGKFVCDSKASYGGTGSTTTVNGEEWKTISSMSFCDGPIPVKKGDGISMIVEYNLKKHPL